MTEAQIALWTKAGYTHVVVYSKTFLTGNLKGITVTDQHITHCSIKTAQETVRGMLEKPETTCCVTRNKYIITEPHIIAL